MNKKQIYNPSKSSESRIKGIDEPHAACEPQFGHPWFIIQATLTVHNQHAKEQYSQ